MRSTTASRARRSTAWAARPRCASEAPSASAAAPSVIETGNARFALHADVFGRDTSNLRVPRYTPIEDGEPLDRSRRVRNSASEARGGAVGGSLFFGGDVEQGRAADNWTGRIGLSADTYENDYGVTAEPDVLIKMKRDHLAFSSERKGLSGPVRAVRLNAGATDYEHKEIEGGGEVGTVFSSEGFDVRLEVEHAPIGPVRGVIGVQHEDFDFSALGEEAFVPGTRTRKTGVFALEELPWVGGTLSAGVRFERALVDSDGDAGADEPRFGAAADRRYFAAQPVAVECLSADAELVAVRLGRLDRAGADLLRAVRQRRACGDRRL